LVSFKIAINTSDSTVNAFNILVLAVDVKKGAESKAV
jgi:hypothetical protein